MSRQHLLTPNLVPLEVVLILKPAPRGWTRPQARNSKKRKMVRRVAAPSVHHDDGAPSRVVEAVQKQPPSKGKPKLRKMRSAEGSFRTGAKPTGPQPQTSDLKPGKKPKKRTGRRPDSPSNTSSNSPATQKRRIIRRVPSTSSIKSGSSLGIRRVASTSSTKSGGSSGNTSSNSPATQKRRIIRRVPSTSSIKSGSSLGIKRVASTSSIKSGGSSGTRSVMVDNSLGSGKKRSMSGRKSGLGVERSSNGGVDKRSSNGGVDKRSSNGGVDKRSSNGGVDKRSSNGGVDKRSSNGGVDKRSSNGGGVDKRSSNGGVDKRSSNGGVDKRSSNGGVDKGSSYDKRNSGDNKSTDKSGEIVRNSFDKIKVLRVVSKGKSTQSTTSSTYSTRQDIPYNQEDCTCSSSKEGQR